MSALIRNCEGCGKSFRVSAETLQQFREDSALSGAAEMSDAEALGGFPLCLECEFGENADPAEVAAETVEVGQ